MIKLIVSKLFFIVMMLTTVGEIKSSTVVHPFHKEAGFIEIFIDNQAQTPVYYDNLMVMHSSGSGSVIEVNAYYPFGMLMPGLSLIAPPDKYNAYKYSAKELQKELELNWGDHGARMLDFTVNRWWVPDPLAEKYYHISPYAYAGNNPIRFIDPNGMWFDEPEGFRKGWNEAVQQFNDKFHSEVRDRMDHPELLLDDLANTVDGLMNLASDLIGISNIVSGKNKTAEALGNTVSTIAELPNMTPEERGVVAAGAGIALTEMALTRKLPAGKMSAAKGGTNLVYQGFDKAGAVKYVGITAREPAVRFAEHAASGTARSVLDYRVIDGATGLTRTQARIWEQTLINQHGLKNLYNIRNSIAPKYWGQYGIAP